MKNAPALFAALAASLVCTRVLAGPPVLQEQARIALPDASYTLTGVAVDGNSLIALGIRPVEDPARPTVTAEWSAFLFERASAGSWPLVRQLFIQEVDYLLDTFDHMSVSMRDGVAAVMPTYVFERTPSGWVRATLQDTGDGVDVEVSSGMILASSGYCGYDGALFQKQPSGLWTITRRFIGQPKEGCDDEFRGSGVDLTSNRVILDAPGEVHVWNRNSDGSWPGAATAIVPKPAGAEQGSTSAIAIEGDYALTTGTPAAGTIVFRNNGGWGSAGSFWRPDSLEVGSSLSVPQSAGMQMLNGLAPIGYRGDPLRGTEAGSVSVFQRDASGNFLHAAKLLASDATAGAWFGRDVDISGRRVAVISNNRVYVYDLPTNLTQPQIIQDNFEDGNSAEWSALAGSSFSVVSSGSTLVYRQSSTVGDAGASRTGVDWKNQAIEAIAIPRTYSSTTGEKWFGLTVRQIDPGNYYYLTVRNSNVVQLRRLQNGTISILASASLPVTLGVPYRLRLEAVGTWIRGYVDGQLRVQARDTLHTHGTASVRMYKAAVDYDDVAISPNPQIALFRENFEDPQPKPWTVHQGVWNEAADGSQVFAQTSLVGDGRVTSGVPADDQVIQVRAKANTFAAGGERWFGALARFRDEQNFYYLTVRNTNQVSLRKLVNGTIFVLDTATLPVSTGRWYSLRLEAVGDSLRGYVDGRLLVDATDSTHASGKYGLATYRTSANFDDLAVTQP